MPLLMTTRQSTRVAVARPRYRAISTTFETGGSASSTVNVPTVSNGEMMLLFGHCTQNVGTDDAFGTPTGWTLVYLNTFSGASGLLHQYCWFRRANAEPASYTVTHSPFSSSAKFAMLSFTGVERIHQTAIGPGQAGTGTANIIVPRVGVSRPGSLLVADCLVRAGSNNVTPPSGFPFVEVADSASVTGPQMEIAYMPLYAPGAVGPFTFTSAVNQDNLGSAVVLQ